MSLNGVLHGRQEASVIREPDHQGLNEHAEANRITRVTGNSKIMGGQNHEEKMGLYLFHGAEELAGKMHRRHVLLRGRIDLPGQLAWPEDKFVSETNRVDERKRPRPGLVRLGE